MIEKIYIARHGYRLNWVTTNWKGETGLPRDPPLAAFGVTQAQELGHYFKSLPAEDRPTLIISSPYYRCLQTAAPTATALDLPLFVEHGLSEWYSPVAKGTGLHPRPSSPSTLRSFFPSIDSSWSPLWYPSRHGESVDEVYARTTGLLEALIPHVEQRHPDTKCILLVGHAATVITLTRELVGDRNLPIRVGCCSLTELTRNTAKGSVVGNWTTVRLADGRHLNEGSTREWGFEDIEVADGKVVEDSGVPGTDHELDDPVGLQRPITSNL